MYLFNKKDIVDNISCRLLAKCKDVMTTDDSCYGRAVVTDAKDAWSEAKIIEINIHTGNEVKEEVKEDDIIMTK